MADPIPTYGTYASEELRGYNKSSQFIYSNIAITKANPQQQVPLDEVKDALVCNFFVMLLVTIGCGLLFYTGTNAINVSYNDRLILSNQGLGIILILIGSVSYIGGVLGKLKVWRDRKVEIRLKELTSDREEVKPIQYIYGLEGGNNTTGDDIYSRNASTAYS